MQPKMRIAVISVALVSLAYGGPAVADDWRGTKRLVDGVRRVDNPAQGMLAPLSTEVKALWRVGGDTDDEDELFGVIEALTTDADGNVYLLDRQLSVVKAFSADGDYLRSIGREGEGPGEFRRGLGLFFTPQGRLAVLQGAPPRVIRFTTEGEPAGDLRLGDSEEMSMGSFSHVVRQGDHLVALGVRRVFHDDALEQVWFLARLDGEGQVVARPHEETRRLEYANLHFDETVWNTFEDRWAVGGDGRIYAAVEYRGYSVKVWNPEGRLEMVVSRDYETRERTEDEKQQRALYYEGMTKRSPGLKLEIAPGFRSISRIYLRDDGRLWVLTGRGLHDRAEGTIGVFDVFDREGRYLREVTLLGEGDPRTDKLYFVGDRLYVVTDLQAATVASRGGAMDDDAEPMSVICYGLDSEALAF